MGKWFTFERVTTVWALLIATVAVITVLVGLGMWISDNSANVASWVQAVGSIAAIAAGFMVARFQLNEAHRRQQDKDDAEYRSRSRVKFLALAYTVTGVGAWAMNIRDSGMPTYSSVWKALHEDGLDLWHSLAALRTDDFPTPGVIVDITSLKIELKAALSALQVPEQMDDRQYLFEIVREVSAKILKRCEILAEELFADADRLATEAESFTHRGDMAKRAVALKNVGHGFNPSDTDNPQTPQQPAASQ